MAASFSKKQPLIYKMCYLCLRTFVTYVSSPYKGKGEGDIKDKTLIIRFQYRELTDKEVKHYEVEGGSNTSKQEKINQKTCEEVLRKVKEVELRACLVKV